MKLAEASLDQVLHFYNGKAAHTKEIGTFYVYGSNGTIGFSDEFNHDAAIILGRVGAYCGSVAVSDDKFWATDNTIVVKTKSEQSLHYWYYHLKMLSLNSYAGGAAQPLLTQGILKGIKTKYHSDIHQQTAIASTLSAYDDLIENNNRRIKLLEEAARLLYQDWFVRLRFPGYEHTSIINGIPEGWERKKINDVCQCIGGGTPDTAKSEYWEDGSITWITPTDITQNNCLVLLDSEKKITELGLKNSSAKLIPPYTILMTSRASVGFFGLIDREVCTNQGFISIIPKEERLRMYFLHNLISRREEIIGFAKGTTYKEINKTTFRNMDIVIPNDLLLQQFYDFSHDMICQTRLLKKQTDNLKAARDLLLPRLMSGEIQV